MGKVNIRHVEDMPVYQLYCKLALDVEKATRDYGQDFRWLRLQSSTVKSLTERYENAAQQLAGLISSIERKIQVRGKGKFTLTSVAEDSEPYGDINHKP